MIKYQLQCAGGHEFEGWFRDSGDYDDQLEAGDLECPLCGEADIGKAVMAPSIARRRSSKSGSKEAFYRDMAAAAHRARDYVEKNFDYVGERFPEEARRIHYGETESRGIFGEATGKEVKELVDEGVSIAPLPDAPKSRDKAGTPKISDKAPNKKLP
ncbi:MAG: DUF1178 family protein [Pseudomonadota bacterium]